MCRGPGPSVPLHEPGVPFLALFGAFSHFSTVFSDFLSILDFFDLFWEKFGHFLKLFGTFGDFCGSYLVTFLALFGNFSTFFAIFSQKKSLCAA